MEIAEGTVRPSALHRLFACAGSGTADPKEDKTSPAAHAGGIAHHVAAICLMTDADPMSYHNAEIERVVMDGDLLDCVVVYVDYIRKRIGEGCKLYIEQKLEMGPISGTADAVLIHPKPVKDEPVVEVVDLKTGVGHWVEADDPQIKWYGSAAVFTYLPDWMTKKDRKRVRTTIVQPRHFAGKDRPIRSHSWTRKDMHSIRLDVDALLNTYKLAEDEADLSFVPGDQCTFCPLKPCAMLNKVATLPIRQPADVESFEIADKLAMIKNMETWIKAVRAEAQEKLEENIAVPGWDYCPGVGNRTWADEKHALEQLIISGMNLEDIAPRVLKSPTQLDKSFGIPEHLQRLVYRPETDARLAKVDSKTVADRETAVFNALAKL